MAHKFHLNKASLLRKFAVYVVIAYGKHDTRLYVGKTGDNREGCNPVISRCGNHFSYNKIHSQIRNKLEDHETREYTYIFDHFSAYFEEKSGRQSSIDEINEMERWLNVAIQNTIVHIKNCYLVNPYTGKATLSKNERIRRNSFRTTENDRKISGIVADVLVELKSKYSGDHF